MMALVQTPDTVNLATIGITGLRAAGAAKGGTELPEARWHGTPGAAV